MMVTVITKAFIAREDSIVIIQVDFGAITIKGVDSENSIQFG
jgi:hypothetical protein